MTYTTDKTERNFWYAVLKDGDDDDWGYGSHDLDEAKEMLKQFPEGYIAKIDETNGGFCIEEIY